ncbi:CynX/NimT family MFS transporter [Solicola sp. PLA-1-18]|uniref:MFS transporter n=1 Tax=Solicola sp. PLA-1-18 TaxID=3380532 RepID=UPI003B7F9E2F
MTTATDGRGRARRLRTSLPWAFVVALLLISFNLRSPFVAVAPLADELRADLDVGAGGIGLLTSLPVLCFGLLAPVALLLVRRAGAEAAVVACLVCVTIGSVVRTGGSFALAVVGTVVIGLGITVGNIVMPVLIRRESTAGTAGPLTGIYTAAMNFGSMVATIVTVPVADAAGWQVALGMWSLVGVVATVVWVAHVGRRRRIARAAVVPPPEVPAHPASSTPVWQRPIAWMLGLAFAGQATSYYALTAWLPTLLGDEIGLGASAAGAASSVFQVCAIIGAIGVPLLALRLPTWSTVGLVGLLWMSFPMVLLLAPQAYVLGSVLGGVAQGGGFAAIFTIVVQVARSDRESARLSAFVQGVGYVVAATGPTVLGLVHDATDAWTVPVLIVVGTTAMFTVLGVSAAVSQARARTA